MRPLGYKFMAAALGTEGARALRKAASREPQLADVLVPRAIVGWLDFSTQYEYEGAIPGVENSYVRFEKTEKGIDGVISLSSGNYSFSGASVNHLAASIALALGLEPGTLDVGIRDTVLARLGRSIDTLAKAQAVMKELKARKAEPLVKMAVIHDNAEAPMTVYRVQNERGQGPYEGMGIDTTWRPEDYNTEDHSPEDDFSAKDMKALDESPAPKFAFSHPDHATKWFSKEGLDHLAREGYTLKAIPASKVWRSKTKTQVMFHPASTLSKVDLPGKTAAPQAQKGPIGPTPPTKQPAMATPKAPKPLSVGKSEAAQACSMCGGHQFKNDRFVGCICWSDLAKSIRTTAYGDGYVLSFKQGVDQESVIALMKAFRGQDE